MDLMRLTRQFYGAKERIPPAGRSAFSFINSLIYVWSSKKLQYSGTPVRCLKVFALCLLGLGRETPRLMELRSTLEVNLWKISIYERGQLASFIELLPKEVIFVIVP
jgi:hypothetical protein